MWFLDDLVCLGNRIKIPCPGHCSGGLPGRGASKFLRSHLWAETSTLNPLSECLGNGQLQKVHMVMRLYFILWVGKCESKLEVESALNFQHSKFRKRSDHQIFGKILNFWSWGSDVPFSRLLIFRRSWKASRKWRDHWQRSLASKKQENWYQKESTSSASEATTIWVDTSGARRHSNSISLKSLSAQSLVTWLKRSR